MDKSLNSDTRLFFRVSSPSKTRSGRNTYTNKAYAAYVMLARASATLMAWAQSPQPLSDARVESHYGVEGG